MQKNKDLKLSIKNHFLYCGLEKEEFDAVKSDIFDENFSVWKILHLVMVGVSILLLVTRIIEASQFSFADSHIVAYICLLAYSLIASFLFFFVFKKEKFLAPRILIYFSIIAMFTFSYLLSSANPNMMAVTFAAMLIIVPLFTLDRPIIMSSIIVGISALYLIAIGTGLFGLQKSGEALSGDCYNVIAYGLGGIAVNIFYTHFRVKDFVLRNTLKAQRDSDETTGLYNKSALTRKINNFISEQNKLNVMIMLDIDFFKQINDKYGHTFGDVILADVGSCLSSIFTKENEVVGRFGGDEFVIFIANGDLEYAVAQANKIHDFARNKLKTPMRNESVSVSIGIAKTVKTDETFDDIFTKADEALYQAKASGRNQTAIYKVF